MFLEVPVLRWFLAHLVGLVDLGILPDLVHLERLVALGTLCRIVNMFFDETLLESVFITTELAHKNRETVLSICSLSLVHSMGIIIHNTENLEMDNKNVSYSALFVSKKKKNHKFSVLKHI